MDDQLAVATAKLVGIHQTGRMLNAQVEGAVAFLVSIQKVGSLSEFAEIEEQLDFLAAQLGEDSKQSAELHKAVLRLKERSGLAGMQIS